MHEAQRASDAGRDVPLVDRDATVPRYYLVTTTGLLIDSATTTTAATTTATTTTPTRQES